MKSFIRWLIPPVCIFCRNITNPNEHVCSYCLLDLPILMHGCHYCARLLLNAQKICGMCLQKKPIYCILHTLFLYETPIFKLILDLKFQNKLTYARLLGEWCTQKIKHVWYRDQPLPQIMIPVPLHTNRLKERGFNQAVDRD